MVYEDYLSCSDYENRDAHSEAGFSAFFHEESSRYFFTLLDADGKVLLKSEGYPQAAARENGIQSVMKNREKSDFYSVKSEDGKFYLSLRAANYREIARSCDCDTEGEALEILPFATGEQIRGGKTMVAEAKKERADDRVDDDYLAVKEYASHAALEDEAMTSFAKFTHENGQHYFAWYDENGDVLMRSEGYPTTSARDNGLASVQKNKDLDERYAIIKRLDRYFVSLKAGNHQEIARSGPFESEEAARLIFPSERAKAAAESLRLKAEEEAKAAAEALRLKEEEAKAAAAAEALRLKEEEEAKTLAAAHVAAMVAPNTEGVADKASNVEDNYLACRDYADKAEIDADGFSKWQQPGGEHYFTWHNADGSVKMRSEGYPTTSARDNGVASVMKNRELKERYATIQLVGRNFVILKAGNHQEIARSCAFEDIAALYAMFPLLNPDAPAIEEPEPVVETAGLAAAGLAASALIDSDKEDVKVEEKAVEATPLVAAGIAATALASVVDEKVDEVVPEKLAVVQPVVEAPKVAAPVDIEDDYLPCSEYETRKINDKVNNVAMFKHENGLYYFAVFNTDGKVRLRSEGFTSAQNRDQELSGALKNINNADMYEVMRKGTHYMSVLKDKTGREVGRSCLQKEEPKVVVPPVAVAGAAAAAVAAASSLVEIPKPKPEPVIETKKVAAPPPPVYTAAAPVAEEAAGGFGRILPWLLGAAVVGGLAWWLLNRNKVETVAVAPTPVEVPATPAPTPTPAPEVAAPIVPAAPSCNLNWILFDFDKSFLTATAKAELDEMAKILKDNKDYVGVLSAHTDARGSDGYNDALSNRRSAEAKKYLVAKGIDAARLKTTASGEGRPHAKNTQDDRGRQFNRRVELYIQDKAGKDVCESIAPAVPDDVKN